MITPQQAQTLLNDHGNILHEFQNIIISAHKHCLRCDDQIIPIILAALQAIANNAAFNPKKHVKDFGMSNIKSLSSDPIQAIYYVIELLNTHFSKEAYQQTLLQHYLPADDSQDQIIRDRLTTFFSSIQNYICTVRHVTSNEAASIYKAVTAQHRSNEIKELDNSNTTSQNKFPTSLAILGIKAIKVGFHGHDGYDVTLDSKNLGKLNQEVKLYALNPHISFPAPTQQINAASINIANNPPSPKTNGK